MPATEIQYMRKEKVRYDRLFLESMSRIKLQAHAKRHGIKANDKSGVLIDKLLGKIILEEEDGNAPADVRGTIHDDIQAHDAVNQTEITTRSIKQIKRTATRTTPHSRQNLQHSSGDSSQQVPHLGSVPPKQIPEVGTDPTVVPMKQTDKDVRVVRRQLVGLFKEQATAQETIDELRNFLEYNEEQLASCHNSVTYLSWRREAVEDLMLAPFKNDRSLWDGSAQLEEGEKNDWTDFVRSAWRWGQHLHREGFKVPGQESEASNGSEESDDIDSTASAQINDEEQDGDREDSE